MSDPTPQAPLSEGLRLAKAVMALARCSRREAEALIEAGAVLLDGVPVHEPARRMQATQSLSLASDAQATLRTLDTPLTLLWHDDREPRSLGLATPPQALGAALPPVLPAPTPARLARLRPLLALQTGQRGLAVWSDDAAVLRRLLDRQRPLEQEWRVACTAPWSPGQIAQLMATGWRASLSQARDGRWTYRLVGRSPEGPPLSESLAASLAGPLLRLRIGALGLSPLAPGQARLLRPGERF